MAYPMLARTEKPIDMLERAFTVPKRKAPARDTISANLPPNPSLYFVMHYRPHRDSALQELSPKSEESVHLRAVPVWVH